jgi:hypothetical protein
MMQSLNSTGAGPLIPDDILKRSFTVFWDELEAALKDIRKAER